MASTTSPPTGNNPKPRRLRLRQANRNSVVPVPARLEGLLPQYHLARLIWEVVGRLDLTAFYVPIEVVEGEPGAPAIDPRILVVLWLYAISQGVSSAREIDRLRVEHWAYIWICGGVVLNYHTISDFRTAYAQALDELMTQVVVRLDQAGLVELETQGQDGMRVRASAGAASFRRQPTLEKLLEQAQTRVAEVAQLGQVESAARSPGQKAAQERAAREREARLAAALAEMPAARAAKKPSQRDEARVSSTDPEARVMKMPDAGYRPAYNWQFSVELSNFAITGVDVVNSGSDNAQMEPMVQQVLNRTRQLPQKWLIDGGFVKLTAIESLDKRGVTVFGPVSEPRDKSRDRYAPLPTDSEIIAQWRKRMGSAEGKAIYKQRCLVELPNAHARSRYGVQQVRVRGRGKVRCVALWVAITHNLLIWIRHLRQVAWPVQGQSQAVAIYSCSDNVSDTTRPTLPATRRKGHEAP
jgi:transposase